MKKVEYTAVGGETGFTNSILVGKRIVGAEKDGKGRAIQIFSGTPNPKEFLYNVSTGHIDYGEAFNPGEPALVLYEDADIVQGCVPVTLSAFSMPDAFINVAYNTSFFANGTPPFTISSFSAPAWMSYNISGSTINLIGTPTIADENLDIPVSFTINNDCGSVNVSELIDVTPVARTLTFTVVNFSGVQIQVNLDERMAVDVNIQSVFADGNTSVDCSVSATASVQLQDQVIPAYQYNASDSNFPTGDWTTVNSYHLYNVIVNNVARFNGDVVQMGANQVTIVLQGC